MITDGQRSVKDYLWIWVNYDRFLADNQAEELLSFRFHSMEKGLMFNLGVQTALGGANWPLAIGR